MWIEIQIKDGIFSNLQLELEWLSLKLVCDLDGVNIKLPHCVLSKETILKNCTGFQLEVETQQALENQTAVPDVDVKIMQNGKNNLMNCCTYHGCWGHAKVRLCVRMKG